MEIKTKKMSQPIKFFVTEQAENIKKKKEEVYEQIKATLPIIDGFRKGTIPRDVAERKFGVEQLYKKVIDEIFSEVAIANKIVSSKDFKIFGDLGDNSPLTIEFIAEVEPTVELTQLDNLDTKYQKDSSITDEDIQSLIDSKLKQNEKIVDVVGRDVLQNLDISFIDFEGVLDGETKPFKGGSSKNFKLIVNTAQKTFVDNFEDQIIGMKIGEEKIINVTFPENYGDKELSGKKANFKVKLNQIKESVAPDLDEFLKKQGCENIEQYKEIIKKEISKDNEETFKKAVIKELIELSNFQPIPETMIEQDLSKEWQNYLRRLNKTEDELLKQDKNIKESFFTNRYEYAEYLIKTTMILRELAVQQNISVTKDDVKNYVTNIATALKYDQDKIQKIFLELERVDVYEMHERAAKNEKVIEFLIRRFKNKE